MCSILIVIIFLNQRRKASRSKEIFRKSNSINSYDIDKLSVMLRDSIKLLISTIKQMRDVNQLLLIPLTIWSGLEQSFLGAQFTKVYLNEVFQ